jgi:hypothetical protein
MKETPVVGSTVHQPTHTHRIRHEANWSDARILDGVTFKRRIEPMRNMHLAVLVVAGLATTVLATTATAQDETLNREVLRALKQLRHEVSILKEQNRYLIKGNSTN